MCSPGRPAWDRPPDLTADGAGPISWAASAAQSSPQRSLGRPSQPFNRRSPVFVGLIGAAGFAVTYLLVQILLSARSVLILIGLAWLIADGLEPVVSWLSVRAACFLGFDYQCGLAVRVRSATSLALVARFYEPLRRPGRLGCQAPGIRRHRKPARS
jgi:hypothetical protein